MTLEHRYLVGERGARPAAPAADVRRPRTDGELRPNPEAARLDARQRRATRAGGAGPARRLRTPSRVETVELPRRRAMLPAIAFVFSRAGCDQAVEQCLAAGLRLTEPGERAADPRDRRRQDRGARRRRPRRPALRRVARGPRGRVRRAPRGHGAADEGSGRGGLRRRAREGRVRDRDARARHQHAGALGRHREALEVHRRAPRVPHARASTPSSPGAPAGAASTSAGYAIVCWSPFVPFDQVASLASRRTDALALVVPPDLQHGRQPRAPLHASSRRTTCSTCRSRSSTPTATSSRSSASSTAAGSMLARQRELAAQRARRRRRVPARSSPSATRSARRRAAARGASAEAIEALRPGDVVVDPAPRRPRRGAQPRAPARRRQPRIVALTPGPRGRAARAPTTSTARRAARPPSSCPSRSRRGTRPSAARPPSGSAGPSSTTTAAARAATSAVRPSSSEALADAPAAPRPAARRTKLRAAAAIERLERDVQRPERRVRGRSESLARQFDRVLRVLEAWGYVDGWALTDAGRAARPPLHRDRPARRRGAPRRPARRPAAARARGGRVVLHLRAPRARRAAADAAGALADEDGGEAGARDRADRARTSTPTRTTPGSPRPARPIPASRPTCTTGRRATTSPTCSTTTR